MVRLRLNKHYSLNLIFLLLIISCKINKKPESIFLKDLELQMVDSNSSHVLFKGQIKINGIFFRVLNEIKYDDKFGEDLIMINKNDSLKVYLNESYYNNFIFDVNEDKEPDINFIFRVTNNEFVNYSFIYNVQQKKYNQIPDTLYYHDIKFLEKMLIELKSKQQFYSMKLD